VPRLHGMGASVSLDNRMFDSHLNVKGAVRRDETILRLGGDGDDFHMSWTADDRQVFALCDGCGWADPPQHRYNSRMHVVTGGPEDARFEDVRGYPELIDDFDDPWKMSRYYGFGTLALDGAIYQFLSTPNVPFRADGPRFVGAKLIYSPDDGATWCNQDGSTPVVWESWEARSKDNMAFFYEPQDAFSIISILQMGRSYGANRDGYVYVYAPNGNTEGTMNELAMLRVPKDRIRDRRAYEYFAGRGASGAAEWTRDVYDRAPVHTFPLGWVNETVHPWSWVPSLAYNEPLGLYMMVNAGTGCADDGSWFGKPSYLGVWTAPEPWGPWTQVLEEEEWTPGGDPNVRGYSPIISPKWIAPDGRSFWLIWSDYQNRVGNYDENQSSRIRTESSSRDEFLRELIDFRPYYAFNAQRVDLLVE
jgi:hypothetical protein